MDARVRMSVQKMAQNRDELSGVGHVMPLHGRTDIINNHVPDRLRPMLAVEQVVPQRGGNDLRDVLMLTNSLDLSGVRSQRPMQSSNEIMGHLQIRAVVRHPAPPQAQPHSWACAPF